MTNKTWFMTTLSMVLLSSMPLAAQDGLTKGSSEVTGLVGIADGEGTFGGAYGKAVSDKLFAFGEFSYIALGSGSSSTVIGDYDVSAKALNFNVGVHYNFTNAFKNKKLVPYAGGGLGILRASVSTDVPGFSTSASDTSFFVNFGGGLRYYVGPKWGLRPEVMVFAGDGSYTRFAVGLFYQF